MPLSVWVFADYALRNDLRAVTVSDIVLALGLRHKKSVYDVINRLIRYGVIARASRGLYTVNTNVALSIVEHVPQPIGRRDYAAVRGKLSDPSHLSLPPQWRDAFAVRDAWLQVAGPCSQGTTHNGPSARSLGAWLMYPTACLITPSGRRVTVIRLANLYVVPTPSLARRSRLYCASYGPITLCSPTLPQLMLYLNPPCPDCAPVVPYPVPCTPEVSGPVADFRGRLIPLSSLPSNARRYEVGLWLRDPYLSLCASLFNVEVRARGGRVYLKLRPKRGVVRRYLASALYHLPVLIGHCLALLASAFTAVADYGRAEAGLSTPQLLTAVEDILSRALYRKPKRAPDPAPVAVGLSSLYLRVKREGRAYTLVLPSLTYHGLISLVAEPRGARVRYFVVAVPLPDPMGTVLRHLTAGYLYLYHNPHKDPDGLVRAEFRPSRNVTRYVTAQELATALYALASRLALSVSLALGHLTAVAPSDSLVLL